MRSENNFEVKNPTILSKMGTGMTLLFLGMLLVYMITTPQPHPAIMISITALFIIPFSVVGIWANRYSIKVKGTSISLQKSFQRRPVCFDVSDITKVVCVIAETGAGQSVKMTVHTSLHGKFTVESLMSNFGKMQAYIEKYAGHKIQTVHKNY